MENKNQIFTSVTLLDGRKCEVLDILAGDIFYASFEFSVQEEKKLGIDFFMYKRMIRIDGKKLSTEELLNISIDDWLSISDIVTAAFTKIEKFIK